MHSMKLFLNSFYNLFDRYYGSMKKEMIKFLQQNIGNRTAEHLQGFGKWLNGRLKAINDEGDIQLDFEIRQDMLNPLGTIHGGALAAILDEMMGMQLFVKSAENDAYFALNIAVDFVKNAKLGDCLTAVPELLRIGRKTANLRCSLYNAEGLLIAQGSSNFLKLEA